MVIVWAIGALILLVDKAFQRVQWCGWRGSNPRPLASEANTLSTELQPHFEFWIISCPYSGLRDLKDQ